MEKIHAEELVKLNDLKLKLDLQNQQFQSKQYTFNTAKDEEVAKNQKAFGKNLNEIRKKTEDQEKLLSEQGSLTLLQKKIEQLEEELKNAKQKYEREKLECESSSLSYQLLSLPQDQQRQRAIGKKITELRAATEDSLRTNKLAELSKNKESVISTANFRKGCEYFLDPFLRKQS